ncbi:MAG: glycosyltransferase, partial [Rickettsiales bacterium]|nr:glycosyltransferase [Rickettsiales bacterium]
MRIVHVITRFLNAGAEENTLLSCNGQVEAGHEVHLIYGPDHNPETCDLLDSRVVQHVSPDLVRPVHPAKDLRALNDLTRIFNVLRPDIVHTHTSKAGIVGRFAASRAKVPCIIHGVHILPFLNVSFVHKWVYLVLEKLAARVTDAFINVSEGMKQANLQYCVGKEAQHYVVPSGMDVAAFREAVAPADWRAFFGKAAEKITSEQPQFVIFVGAFEARKRHVPFLHVFREVVHSCPNAVLLLLGEGKEEPVIRETILSLGLERHVILAGFRRD